MEFEYRPSPPPQTVINDEPRPRPVIQPRVYVVPVVVAVNVLLYLAVGLSGADWMNPDPERMLDWGADLWAYTTAGQWWRLLTSAFLHFGLIHLFANMYALASVGPLCERLFGSVFFGVLYFLSAILSGLASIWWDRGAVSAGASGAVFAVFGALIVYVSIHRASFHRGAARSMLQGAVVMVGFNIWYGLNHPNISNSAHLGGLAAGLMLGAVLARPLVPAERRQRQTRPRAALGIGLGVAAVAVTVALLPKNHAVVDVGAERAFADADVAIVADQNRALATIDRIEAAAKKEKWTAERHAEAIEKELVPIWDQMIKRLQGAVVPPGSQSRERFELLLAYVASRREAYAKLAEAMRSGEGDELEQFNALIDRGNRFVEQINGLKKH
jgi:rhomboid protease GluP